MFHPKQLDFIEDPGLPSIYHIGPPLSEGKLPSVFYFALSGVESLTLDPYNQPAIFLAEHGLRVFSLTLPAHEEGHPHREAMKRWAERIASGHDIVGDFAAACHRALDFLIDLGYVDRHHIGVAGLSRGAFIAGHVAAQDERIRCLLGFSPLTKLTTLDEFNPLEESRLRNISLHSIIDRLASKTIRCYIGNRDMRVGTPDCFTFIHSLAEAAYAHNRRSPPVELVIFPSIGHKGHGTPPEIFRSGADWLAQVLKPVIANAKPR